MKTSVGKKLVSLLLCLSLLGAPVVSVGAQTTPEQLQSGGVFCFSPDKTITASTEWKAEDWKEMNTSAQTAQVVSKEEKWLYMKAIDGNNAGNRAAINSTAAGTFKNGTISATIRPTTVRGDIRFGLQVRYSSQSRLTWIGYDASGWYIQCKGNKNLATARKSPELMADPGKETTISVTFIDEKITLVVDGKELFKDDDTVYKGNNVQAGEIGFMLGNYDGKQDMYVKDITYKNLDTGSGDTSGYDWKADTWKDSNPGKAEIKMVNIAQNGYYELKSGDNNNSAATSAVVVNQSVGSMRDGRIEAAFTPQTNAAYTNFAFVYRYTDINNCAWFGYDQQGWYWQTRIGGKDNYTSAAGRQPGPAAGAQVDVALDVDGNHLNAAVNGKIIFDDVQIPGLDTLAAGYTGFITKKNSSENPENIQSYVKITDFHVVKFDIDAPKDSNAGQAKLTTIATDAMAVTIDESFPRVVKYEMGGEILNGQPRVLNTLQIAMDGQTAVDVIPKVAFEKQGNNQAVYTMTAKNDTAGIDAVITAKLKAENNIVSLDITNVKNNKSDSKLNTIYIPDLSLVSVTNAEQDAAFIGSLMSNNTTVKGDKRIAVDRTFTTSSPDYNTGGYMYSFVSNSKFSAGLWSNSEANDNKRVVKASQSIKDENGESYTYVGLGSGEWTYQNNQMPVPQGTMPSTKVVIVKGDQNEDNKVDWQDGAIAFRSIMNNPFKSEGTPELINQRIVENFASQAAHPFLETLDGVKRVSLATDGLGQQILLKGYASEGHDSAHPDYGDIGTRIGGTEDMKTLLNEGEAYGAKFGVHINANESYPEAKSFNEDLINKDAFGWNWLDESYSINQMYDLYSGSRDQRLDKLYNALGGEDNKLDFIYLDVWGSQSWPTRRVSEQFNKRGWRCANEWGYANEYDGTWNHWAVDLSYGGANLKGINSDVARFLRNHQKDSWVGNYPQYKGTADHPLLGGMDVVGFEGWQREKDFNSYIDTTFAVNIPTKFLQHYLITNWEDDPAVDSKEMNAEKVIKLKRTNENGSVDTVVVSRKDGSRGRIITFNGRTVLDTDNSGEESYLLPWFWGTDGKETEDKLYHYNKAGGKTTWDLPEGWQNAMVYSLSSAGKKEVQIAAVVDGKITLDAAAETPYVLYKAAPSKLNPTAEELKWGYGTHLIDPNFSSLSLGAWTISGNDASIVNKQDNNNPVLQISNKDAVTTLSQTITGLVGKKSYAAIVAVDNESDEKASLEVATTDGKVASNFTLRSILTNSIGVNAHNNSNMQNMYVFFTVPEGATTATLTLKREAGEGFTQFDEVRIVETTAKNQIDDLTFVQNFEKSVQGVYPFIVGDYLHHPADIKTHLSQKNAPYTQRGWNNRIIDDVISGDWSLKAHQLINTNTPIWQTIPQTFYFKPNTTYTISFDYESGTDNAYGFIKGNGAYDYASGGVPSGTRMNPLAKTSDGPQTFTTTVTTGNEDDSWIGIFSNPGISVDQNSPSWKLGAASFVLDNLVIREGSADVRNLALAVSEMEQMCSEESRYTIGSWKMLKKSIEHGKTILAQANPNQEEADSAVKAINTARDALVDMNILNEALSKAAKLNEQNYTAESWGVLATAVTAGKNLKEDATAQNITDAAKAIEDAIKALVPKSDPNPGHGSDSNSGSDPSIPTVTFVSDTTADFDVKSAYQFKITSTNGQVPTLVVGTAGVFDTQLVKASGNDYYFKLIAIGKPGAKAGIYVNGVKLLVATVDSAASSVKSDTTLPFKVKAGKTYTFKITAESKPAFVAGTSSAFKAEFIKAAGKDYYFKVTAVGKAGTASGFYINNCKIPTAVATVLE